MEIIKNWISNIWSVIKTNTKIKCVLINFIIILIVGVFSLKAGVILALLASLAKEVYDEYNSDGTGWNWEDLIADVIGITLGILIVL